MSDQEVRLRATVLAIEGLLAVVQAGEYVGNAPLLAGDIRHLIVLHGAKVGA